MGRFVVMASLAVILVSGFFLWQDSNFVLHTNLPNVFGENTVAKADPHPANNWFPKLDASNKNSADLNLSSKSAIIVDYETGEVLFAKGAHERLPAGSIIKIMTALLALESAK